MTASPVWLEKEDPQGLKGNWDPSARQDLVEDQVRIRPCQSHCGLRRKVLISEQKSTPTWNLTRFIQEVGNAVLAVSTFGRDKYVRDEIARGDLCSFETTT